MATLKVQQFQRRVWKEKLQQPSTGEGGVVFFGSVRQSPFTNLTARSARFHTGVEAPRDFLSSA